MILYIRIWFSLVASRSPASHKKNNRESHAKSHDKPRYFFSTQLQLRSLQHRLRAPSFTLLSYGITTASASLRALRLRPTFQIAQVVSSFRSLLLPLFKTIYIPTRRSQFSKTVHHARLASASFGEWQDRVSQSAVQECLSHKF